MSVLNHLKEYRVVQITLPRNGGESTVVDGVALATEPPVFEVTFLPDQLQPVTFDDQAGVRLTFADANGTAQKLSAEVVKVVSDTKLQLRALDNYSQDQKRAYFRVDAALSVSYWPLADEEEDATAQSVQTPVNVSGGGIRIPVKDEMRAGSKVGLEIILDAPVPRIIECVALVVRCFRLGGVMQLALRFVDIEEEDQDAIVAYCFAEQRKQLRLKVHMMGLDS